MTEFFKMEVDSFNCLLNLICVNLSLRMDILMFLLCFPSGIHFVKAEQKETCPSFYNLYHILRSQLLW